MRSARTDRRVPAPDADPNATGAWQRELRRVARSLVAGMATLVVLAACATGAAEEARLGQEREALTDPDLPRQQATRTSERFFPKTPTPTPAPPPIPTLGELVVTLGVDGDVPQGSYASVPADAGNVYAAALLNGVHEGQVVSANWVDATGAVLTTSRVEIEADADQRWVALPFGSAGGAAPGEYAVYLYVGERRLSSLLFQVGPAGSGGQMLPQKPDNPSADRGGPGETVNQRGAPGAPTQPSGAPGSQQNPQGPDYGQQAPQGQGQDPNAQQQAPVQSDPNVVPGDGGQWVPTAPAG